MSHNLKNRYINDVQFFQNLNIETVELKDAKTEARILVVPQYQGRVMTSSADGQDGDSFGWINYDYIASRKISNQFNPFGGEERFWLGPEGGQYSYYFQNANKQDFADWKVPGLIDTENFEVIEKAEDHVKFVKNASLKNASGFNFDLSVERTIKILTVNEIAELLKINLPDSLSIVAFRTDNKLSNIGENAWTKQTGMPSVWMLCMLNPTPTTTIFIPYRIDGEGAILKDDYFGKVPSDRLKADNGMIYFKADGKLRSKIGVSQARAKNLLGSYDSEKKVLTLAWFNLPAEKKDYVNAQWGHQTEPFVGDAINSYNDGPLENGSVMGPFYEIETSSPAANLAPGESIIHSQCLMHIQGNMDQLNTITESLFGVELSKIESVFNK